MISQLHGAVIESAPGSVVVDVAGLGYELGVSSHTASALPEPGGEVRLYTRLQVRQDALTLFGFSTAEERAMFDRLISVSSVGARLALAVLSTFTVSQLYGIVMEGDAVRMALVPGVGKKTAQRLILELKGTLEKAPGLDGALIAASGRQPSPAAPAAGEQARAALLSMGFSPQEAGLALGELEDHDASVEELLAAALRRLGGDA